jgi:hypothetical protein
MNHRSAIVVGEHFYTRVLVELNGALSNPFERDKGLLTRLRALHGQLLKKAEAAPLQPADAGRDQCAAEGAVSQLTSAGSSTPSCSTGISTCGVP